MKICSSFIILSVIIFSPNLLLADEIRIALRAHEGNQRGVQLWKATADYLSEKIPEHHFTIVPFDNISALDQAISRNEFDFCLTNPSSYIKHKKRYGSKALATLVNKRQGKGYSRFGSVIFTRSDRDDINSLNDIKGKSFIAVDERAFGGWQVTWDEFLKNHINPYTDFEKISFAGGIQQDVIFSVRDGHTDVGTVRTDMLERLSASGEINLENYKIIGLKKSKGFPFLHSTNLYPEWAFSTAREIEDTLKAQIVAALLSITADSTAAKNGRYIGWISPLDYTPVEKLLEKLHIGPYDITTMSSFDRLKSQYGTPLVLIIAAFTLLTTLMIYMLLLNRRINKAQHSLKQEVLTRESLERQLMHIQKMESLGQLTGGIAHDFNNMLASMLGYTELCLNLELTKSDEKLTSYLTQVLSSGDRAKLLISQMLAFSRTEGDKNRTETVLANTLIKETEKLLRPLIPSNIDLVFYDNTDTIYIKVNRVMIDQVLMNLCLNSKDALKNKNGKIEISISLQSFSRTLCNSCFHDISGTFVAIEIKDNGTGIEPNIKELLFEPFFSTKEVGKGTGMGLSMVHGIIHEHGGHILLESAINIGTTFTILLPTAHGIQVSPQKLKTHKIERISKAQPKKHIMIIDDEVSITSFLDQLLQDNNFAVTTFNDSQKALNYFKKHHKEIDLVVTDQTMPSLTGIELSKYMHEINKDTSIFLCSGYSEQVNTTSAKDLTINRFIEKPINTSDFIKTVLEVTS